MEKSLLKLYLIFMMLIFSSCSSIDFTTVKYELTKSSQPFLDIRVVGFETDTRGNIGKAKTTNILYDIEPEAGYNYALIDLQFSNPGSSDSQIHFSELYFQNQQKENLEAYFFYPEDLTGEKGKEGYFPLQSKIAYSEIIKPEEKLVEKFLVVIPENETLINVEYDDLEPRIITFK
ncbi:MAG: hypothetical protein M5R37_09185 [Melioribacteraceae bacterium]|nr:hypothetical protein [Melioribacteraceae bacterium]